LVIPCVKYVSMGIGSGLVSSQPLDVAKVDPTPCAYTSLELSIFMQLLVVSRSYIISR